MSDLENINPSEQKLQQIGIPNADQAWQAMQATLDGEMPVEKKRRRGLLFWFLFPGILATGVSLLFLLPSTKPAKKNEKISSNTSSVKHIVPGNSNDSLKHNAESGSDRNELSQQAIILSEKNDKNISAKSAAQKALAEENIPDKKIDNAAKKENTGNKKFNKTGIAESTVISKNNGDKKTVSAIIIEKKKLNRKDEKQDNKLFSKADDQIISTEPALSFNGKKPWHQKSNKAISNISKPDKNDRKISALENPVAANTRSKESGNDDIKLDDSAQENEAIKNDYLANAEKKFNIDSSFMNKKSAIISDSSIAIKKIDSLSKLLAAVTKRDSAKNKKSKAVALAAGIGMNQLIPIAGQQYSKLNINGNSGVLTDYIPVPMLRLYLSRKLYIQLEAEINSPQFTKYLLLTNDPKTDTVGSSLIVSSQDSAIIRKLFYFNVPVSVHYSPFKNFYVGAGLQFSKLTNSVGTYASRNDTSTNGYSTYLLTSFKTGNLKNDPIHDEIKQSEWRFLFDVNYKWRNLELGLRYTQAFGNFIDSQISGTQVVQARNSSAKFYLRYILWNNKRAQKIFSK